MNSIKAIAAGLIALAALLPVSAPAANIGVYPDTCNNKEKGYTLITINGVIQPDDGEKFVHALARGNEAKASEINDRCDTLVHRRPGDFSSPSLSCLATCNEIELRR
jgi:hypothetical protein